jgi:hypothetical protein
LQKCFRRAELHKNIAEIPLQQDNTQTTHKFENRESKRAKNSTVCSTPPTKWPKSYPLGFPLLWALKEPMEKGVGVMIRLLKKWLQV